MGVAIKYKGSTIASMNADGTKTLKTAGKYCEGDIGVEYSAPTPTLISKSINSNGTYSASSDGADGYSGVVVNVPTGSMNSKCWIFSTDSDSSKGAFISILDSDQWLAAHREDDSLTITMVPLFQVTSVQQTIVLSVCSNRILYGSSYDRFYRGANSSNSLNGQSGPVPIKDVTSSYGAGFSVDSNGGLKYRCFDYGGQVFLPAGDWLITASVESI